MAARVAACEAAGRRDAARCGRRAARSAVQFGSYIRGDLCWLLLAWSSRD